MSPTLSCWWSGEVSHDQRLQPVLGLGEMRRSNTDYKTKLMSFFPQTCSKLLNVSKIHNKRCACIETLGRFTDLWFRKDLAQPMKSFSVPFITSVTSQEGKRDREQSYTGWHYLTSQHFIFKKKKKKGGLHGVRLSLTLKQSQSSHSQSWIALLYKSYWIHFTDQLNQVISYRLMFVDCTRIQHLQCLKETRW